jgi:hypothetical protein
MDCSNVLFLNFCCSEQPPNEGGGEENNEAAPGGDLTEADFDSNWDEAIETFDGMGLPEELLRGIYSYGFEKPSAIQQRAIKPTMLGRDLIAQAQSGTVSETLFVRIEWRNCGTIQLRLLRGRTNLNNCTIFRV